MKWTVEYVNYGIGNRFPGRYIELNNKLKKKLYSPLHDEILNHEKGHSESYSIHDIKHDIGWLKNKNLYRKFVLTTPNSWVQFLPIYKSQRGWAVDVTLSTLWLFGLAFSILIISLAMIL